MTDSRPSVIPNRNVASAHHSILRHVEPIIIKLPTEEGRLYTGWSMTLGKDIPRELQI
jgi:hypothetical protein